MKSWNEMKRYLIDNNNEYEYDTNTEIIDINADKLNKEQMDEIFSWDGFAPDDVQVEMFGDIICVSLVGGTKEHPEQEQDEKEGKSKSMKNNDGLIIINLLCVSLAIVFALCGIETSEAPGTMAQSISTMFYLLAAMNAIAVTFVDFIEIKFYFN